VRHTRQLFVTAIFNVFMNVFTALHGMQTRSSDDKAVCPSV